MVESERPKRPRLNADKRRALKAAKLMLFMQQYGRKANSNDPNDRHYDREIEKAVKRMKPDELDRLLRDDEE